MNCLQSLQCLKLTVEWFLLDAPQALPETTVHGLTLGRTVDVTVAIQANPAPHVLWVVDGMSIEQGQEHDRYAARVPERLVSCFLFLHECRLFLYFGYLGIWEIIT